MGTEEREQALALIDYPRVVVEHIQALLASVGIQLPAIAVQVALLVIVVALCGAVVYAARRDKIAALPATVAAAALGFVAVAVVGAWVVEVLFPLSPTVSGTVVLAGGAAPELLVEMRVHLLDAGGHDITVEGGRVDSRNGHFGLAYDKRLGDRPHSLRAETPNCRPISEPLPLPRLRAGGDVELRFTCEPLP
jgi:hypothetical protein